MIPLNTLNSFSIVNVHNRKERLTGLYYTHKNRIVMTNSKKEHEEHEEFWKNATGDILITGLGLGFSHKPLIDNETITSVTIIEKYQDVIDLVWEHCPKDDRFNIIHTDANIWEIPEESHWGCIWIDHWVYNISEDTEEEFIKSMTDKYSPYCDWLGLWLNYRGKTNERSR